MRGTTLSQLITMYRSEAGMSLQPAQGVQTRDFIIHALNRTQETLWDENYWPHLKIWRNEAVSPGEVLYTWPADIVAEDVQSIWDTATGLYTPMSYGISIEDRNNYPTTTRNDPALKWQMVNGSQYEIWPKPAIARDLLIEGYRRSARMTADSDVALLDDNLIVLTAVSEELARQKKPDAQIKAGKAERLKLRLLGRLTSDKRGNIIPMLPGMLSPNSAYLGGDRRPYALPPPIPR